MFQHTQLRYVFKCKCFSALQVVNICVYVLYLQVLILLPSRVLLSMSCVFIKMHSHISISYLTCSKNELNRIKPNAFYLHPCNVYHSKFEIFYHLKVSAFVFDSAFVYYCYCLNFRFWLFFVVVVGLVFILLFCMDSSFVSISSFLFWTPVSKWKHANISVGFILLCTHNFSTLCIFIFSQCVPFLSNMMIMMVMITMILA